LLLLFLATGKHATLILTRGDKNQSISTVC